MPEETITPQTEVPVAPVSVQATPMVQTSNKLIPIGVIVVSVAALGLLYIL